MDVKTNTGLVVSVEAIKKPGDASKVQELAAMEEALKKSHRRSPQAKNCFRRKHSFSYSGISRISSTQLTQVQASFSTIGTFESTSK